MFKIKTAARLAIIIMMIVNANIWLSIMLRMTPDPNRAILDARHQVSEIIAIYAGNCAETNRLFDFGKIASQYLGRNTDIRSIGLRGRSDGYRFATNGHESNWDPSCKDATQSQVSITTNGRNWGTVEICFAERVSPGWLASYLHYPHSVVLFISALTGLLSWLTFTQTFKFLNPSKIVPGRVRSALDSLAEGLVLLDKDLNIVHTNEAFSGVVGCPADGLIGQPLGKFGWRLLESDDSRVPWEISLNDGLQIRGALIELNNDGNLQKYNVNSNQILDGSGNTRGVLVSFDNVTLLEQKKQDLAATIDSLRDSRDEIKKQNEQLKFLASRDPLTKCYNRRSFWELFEHYWKECPKSLLNIVMVDIDHFKSINDNFGHSKGDEVLRETGELLLQLVGDNGLVCRYGGEEIAILLPNIDFEAATFVANGIHEAFNRCMIGGLKVTASIGISNRLFAAMDSQHLLDQADQCLYSAKRNGRNRVVRFDQIDQDAEPEKQDSTTVEALSGLKLSYSTAMALFSTLAYRDEDSATHGMRLAELCVFTGRKFLDPRMLYVLEISALLHEIGQLGFANSQHHSLTGQDLSTNPHYRSLLQVTCEILRSSFNSRVLKSIICGIDPLDSSLDYMPNAVKADLGKCREIFLACDQFLHDFESHTGSTKECIDRAVADERTIGHWAEYLRENVSSIVDIIEKSKEVHLAFDEESASELLLHIEDLCACLAAKDINKLRDIVNRLHDASSQFKPSIVTDTVSQLHSAIEKRGAEFDDLLELADQLLDLCRLNRSGVIGSVGTKLKEAGSKSSLLPRSE